MLFNPEMILLCDDDTYVNFRLFHRLKIWLRNRLNSVGEAPPVARVMGAMMFRQMLTLAGFIPGGGGYLMGREVLDRLHSRYLHPPPNVNSKVESTKNLSYWVQVTGYSKWSTSAQSFNTTANTYAYHLNLLRAALTASSAACPDKSYLEPLLSSSRSSADEINQRSFKLGVRVIDLCTNLFAGPRTCHHSDHSMSRCLFYGIHAVPDNRKCDNFNDSMTVGKPVVQSSLQMCSNFRTDVDTCDLRIHLTCHRYRPVSEDDYRPVRITSSQK